MPGWKERRAELESGIAKSFGAPRLVFEVGHQGMSFHHGVSRSLHFIMTFMSSLHELIQPFAPSLL